MLVHVITDKGGGGVRGAGRPQGVREPPTISSTPAVAAAIRAATGLALTRIPVRPEHVAGLVTKQVAPGW